VWVRIPPSVQYVGCSSEEEHLIVVQDVVGSSPISHPKVGKTCVGSTGKSTPTTLYGPVSEWLGGGLQNRLRWFESNRDLKYVLVEQLVRSPVCKTGSFRRCRFESYLIHKYVSVVKWYHHGLQNRCWEFESLHLRKWRGSSIG
jgi:hypothetical protein